MRYLSLLASLSLVACYGGERADTGVCPAGETCSSSTPGGLQFVGDSLADDLLASGPAPTAIGGTQDIDLQYQRSDGTFTDLDLPYQADDDGGLGVRVDHTTGSVVTVRGVASRSNYLRILDASSGALFDRKMITGAAIDSIALIPTDFEMIPDGAELAWATGDQQLGVALTGAVQESTGPTEERLIDTSMQLSLPGADRVAWDTLHLPAATAGTYAVAVTAGDRPATSLPLVIADHADAVTAIEPPGGIPPQGSAEVCFEATTGGRYLVGLAWTFAVDGVAQPSGGDLLGNCAMVSTEKTSGTVTVQATAGGQSTTVTLAVGAMARTAPRQAPAATRHRTPTDGDRALLTAAAARAVR